MTDDRLDFHSPNTYGTEPLGGRPTGEKLGGEPDGQVASFALTDPSKDICKVCGWDTSIADYELGTHEYVNCSTKCLGCGVHRPAYMGPTRFLDTELRPTMRENTNFPLEADSAVIEAARRVQSAWVVKGSHPTYHDKAKCRLRRDWPRLTDSIKGLLQALAAREAGRQE